MYIYKQQSVDDVLADLESRVHEKLRDMRPEIQDGGSFLLITGQLVSGASDIELAAVHDEIKEVMSEKFPDRYGDYSWMFVIYRAGKIVCTVLPKMLV